MENEFKHIVKGLVDERLEVIRANFVSSNKSYRKISDRQRRIEDKIDSVTEGLPDEAKKLILIYEDLEASLESLLQKAIYMNGLRDGIRLANISRKVLKL